MSSRVVHVNSEEIERLSNGFRKMGREFKSSHASNHTFGSVHVNSMQNGWDDDTNELKEEDLWDVDEASSSWGRSNPEKRESKFASLNEVEYGYSSKGYKNRTSCLSMELEAAGVAGRKKDCVGVGIAGLEVFQNGGGKNEVNGGWAPGFSVRKVKTPQFLGGGWYDHRDTRDEGGVPQSAPMSVPVWPPKCGMGYSSGTVDDFDGGVGKEDSACDDDDDDADNDGDSDDDNNDDTDDVEDGAIRGRRLAPHEIVDREYARSQSTTSSVIEGAGRTLKGMDLRRVRNAVWSRTGFVD